MRRRFHASDAPSTSSLKSPCIPCISNLPYIPMKERSTATNQEWQPDYPDQAVRVHIDSTLMGSFPCYPLFGHNTIFPVQDFKMGNMHDLIEINLISMPLKIGYINTISYWPWELLGVRSVGAFGVYHVNLSQYHASTKKEWRKKEEMQQKEGLSYVMVYMVVIARSQNS